MTFVKYAQHLNLKFKNEPIQPISVLEGITPFSTIVVREVFERNQIDRFLITFRHQQLTSELDMTGVTPYVVLGFDQNRQFLGAHLSLGEAEGTYSIKVQGIFVLIIPFEKEFPLTEITSFEFDTRDKSEAELFWEQFRRMPSTLPKDKKGFILHGNNRTPSSHQPLKRSPSQIQSFSKFPPGYGKFPYLIVHVYSACYLQVPIYFSASKQPDPEVGICMEDVESWMIDAFEQDTHSILKNKLLELVKERKAQMEKKQKQSCRMCLVLGPNHGIYFEKDEITESEQIPYGGSLVNSENEIIAMNAKHYRE